MDHFRRSLLLAYDLLRLPEEESSATYKHFSGPLWEDAYCHWCRPNGAPAIWQRVDKRIGDLPPLKREPLQSARILTLELSEKYLCRVALLELAEGDVHHLTQDKDEAGKDLKKIVNIFLPLDEQYRVWPLQGTLEYSLLLVSDSWQSKLESQSDQLNSLQAEEVKKLWADLNLTHMAPIPELYADLLILPARVLAGSMDSSYMIWGGLPSLREDSAIELELPETLIDFVVYIAATAAVVDLTGRLRNLPVSPVEAKKWGDVSSASLLEGYLVNHFKNRDRILTELLICSQTFRAVSKMMRKNAMAQFEQLVPFAWPEVLAHPLKFRRSIRLRNERLAAEEEYKHARENADKWSGLVSDYLRDLLNARVAASNLSLQVTIQRLTVIALILGLVAIAVGLIPDTARAAMWKFFFGN